MRILRGAPLAYRAGVALGLGCGLRVGEVLGLTPSRADFRAGTVTIDRQQQRGRLDSLKTWRGHRTIAPPDLVMLELRRAIRETDAPEVPFRSGGRGGSLRPDGFYKVAWRPALVAAALAPDRFKFHSARHFAVSNMLAAGVPLPEVAASVGDAVETISSVYAHFLRDEESRAKVALDLALSGSAELVTTHVQKDEFSHPNTPEWKRQAAERLLRRRELTSMFVLDVSRLDMAKLGDADPRFDALAGERPKAGGPPSHVNDALIVYTAHELGIPMVTAETKRMPNRCRELGVEGLSPAQLVERLPPHRGRAAHGCLGGLSGYLVRLVCFPDHLAPIRERNRN